MPSKMTSRERVVAAIRREPVDYVPCCGFFNPLTPPQRRGHPWNFPWPEEADWEEQTAFQVEQLGLDALLHVSVPVTRQAEGVSAYTYVNGDVLHKVYTTPAGKLRAAVRYDDRWPHGEDIPLYSDFNIGHFVVPWIKSAADLECLKQLQLLRDADEVVAECRARFAHLRDVADTYSLAVMGHAGTGLTGAQHLFGVRPLCFAVVDHPELVDAYLEHEHRINLRAIEVLAELGVDICRRNGFYETADFYGPGMLEHFLGRRLRAEADAARRAGMATAYTVHTGIMPILDYLAGLNFDSLMGIDIAFPGVETPRVRERLASTKAFWTGPSSTFHIWKGPEATRQAVRDVFECFGKRGLILSQCVSSHSIMPWESTAAMIEEWKRLR